MISKNQYDLIKKAFIGLKKTHLKAKSGDYDFKSLNYYADMLEGFEHLKDFNAVREQIQQEI